MFRRILLIALLLTSPAFAEDLVVDTAWLAGRLDDPKTVVLHVAKEAAAYQAGHIPGARFVPWGELTATRDGIPNELPPVEKLEALFARVGVGPDTRVVLYGDEQGLQAARAWFTLDYLGFANASVLDGGLEKWRAEGRTVAKGPTPAVAAADFPAALVPFRVTDLEPVRDASWLLQQGNRSVALVDARPPAQFTGQEPGDGITRPGHIPGAVNLFWMESLVSKENPVLRPLDELRERFRKAGIEPGTPVITYCRTGGQAAHAYFVARLLGHPTTMYDGSYFDWSRRPDTEVVKGP